MNSFDEKTQQALGYYVYMLVDPNGDEPFTLEKDTITAYLTIFGTQLITPM